MAKDTRVELTEERVREIVREEIQRALGEIGDTMLRIQMGEKEFERHLQSRPKIMENLSRP